MTPEVQQAAERWRANKYPEGGKIADDFLLADAKAAEIDSHAALLAAAKAVLEVLPGLEVRNWPPGHVMKREAIEQLTAAIAAAEGTDR